MPVINDKSESLRINTKQAKTTYADYLSQTRCANINYNIEGGSAGANSETTLTVIRKGAVLTSCSEVQCIESNSCPIIYPAPVPSIITDDLLLHFEAGDSSSYSGTGTTWINIGTGGTTYNATIAGGGGGGPPTFDSGPPATFTFTRHLLNSVSSYTSFNRIYLTRPPGIGDDFTFCAWIKTTQVGQGLDHYQLMYILSTETGNVNNDFGFGLDVNGKLTYGDGKTGGSDITIRTTASVNTGAWIFVAVSRKKSTGEVILYINGAADTTGTCNVGNTLDTGTDLVIGSEKDFPGYTMGGQIAAILGNTSVLTAAQILQNYNATKATYGY